MAVSKRLRYEILRRDNHQCTYCGATAPDVKLTVDHVVPVALGGSDEPTNLTTACTDCNGGKSASSPDAPIVAGVEQDALRWTAAMKQAEEQQLADLRALNDYVRDVYMLWTDRFTDDSGMPDDWATSAERWYASGLRIVEVQYGIDVAVSATHVRRWDKWKYACGVIYKRLRDRQEMAAKLLVEANDSEPADDDGDEENERHNRAYERSLRMKWLVLSGQHPELGALEANLIETCYAVWNESEFWASDVWEGAPDFVERFGPGAQTLLNEALGTWHDEPSERAATEYIARLLVQAFEAFDDPWANPSFSAGHA